MSKLSKLLKKAGKVFPGTGKHAAKRAEKAANQMAQEAQQAAAALEAKTKKERARAQKLAIRGLRSRRAAAMMRSENADNPSYGSPTIG